VGKIKKISKKIDEILSSHPKDKKRIEKLLSGELLKAM
jgi:Zn-dependent protease with chaperone function